MKPPVNSFWAKLKPYGGGEITDWHPLTAHSADVAACLEALLETSLVRTRLARVGGLNDLSDTQIHRLCVFAAFHDLGKFNIGFQNKRLRRPPFTSGHVKELLSAFCTSTGTRIAEALRLEELEAWGEEAATVEDFLITSFAHHGRPQPISGTTTPGAWEPTDALDPLQGMRELRAEVEEWYPDAFSGGGLPLPSAPPFHHAYNGLLTLADWIGSNESFFPFQENGDSPRIDFARHRAREAMSRIGLDPSVARSALVERPPGFRDIWSFDPRPAQEIMERLDAPVGGSLTILEAPTGSGKTEAALIRFFHLFSDGVVDGLYFALPTRAAASQMYRRVKKAVAGAIPSAATSLPFVILAVPGYLAEDDDDGLALPASHVQWPDVEWKRWRYRTWASERPKRYLSGMISVGTVDQALLSTLAVDHSHMRAASLLRQLLVVDEVHASDAYMSRLLEAVVERQIAGGGHVLLMSATLGEAARYRYLSLAGDDGELPRSHSEAVSATYPQIVTTDTRGSTRVYEVEGGGESRSIDLELLTKMEEAEEVAARALDAAAAGARVLVIRNTVSGCVELQRALERVAGSPEDGRLFTCAGVPAPHHSRFARQDRRLLDRGVENAFGGSRADGGCVLSATQTVEQSLDIDADLLITDLCPADVLLQRVGRLHRHPRDTRPDGYRDARVVVLVPTDRNLGTHIQDGGQHAGHGRGPHGLGTVYEDLRVLEATWSALEDFRSIKLPRDNRRLVEAATHPDVLKSVVEEKGGPWVLHGQTVDGLEQAATGLARLNLADWTVPFGDPGSLFPDDPGERIKTRLGEGDRRAKFAVPVSGPFGADITEITIPAWMATGAREEDVEILASEARALSFRFGERTYRYDRLGLRTVSSGGQEGDA